MSLYDWSYAYDSIPGISRAPRGKIVGYPYQEAAVQQIVNVRSHTYCGHHPGCIGGDEIIKVMRHGKVFPIQMRDLYRKFNKLPGRDPWTKPGKCSTNSLFPNGELRHNEILKVVNSGEKATVIVTLASGKTLRCTPDHEIHTPKGWVRADNIETGSVVHTNDDIVFYPRDDSVVSVVRAGVTDTYDIVMAEPARSFVASGVIVHNSGKTPIALLTSLAYTLSDPILVVCPPSIVYQWADRALEWTGVHWSTATTTDQVRTLLRQPSATIPARFIVPDTLIHEIPWCAEHFALFIIDEAHRFKARDARRTKAVFGYGVQQGLRQRSDKVLALSGTPMPNNPTELYPYLHACHASLAPNFAQFAARYCPPESQWINTKRGRQEILVYKKATNGAELGRLLRETCLIRPKRENILSQLPVLRVDRFQLKIGVKSKRSVAEVLAAWKSRDPKADVALATERKDVGSMKATASLDWLETLLEAGESPVIFTWHKEAAEILGSKLGVPVIHGGRSPEERMADIAKFARGEAKAIVGTIGSCGTGIDGLQHRTDLMIFIERSYVPADMDQAYGRIWRIGQKAKVRVVIVEADHAIDHAIDQSLSRKSDDIATIVG